MASKFYVLFPNSCVHIAVQIKEKSLIIICIDFVMASSSAIYYSFKLEHYCRW